jgi:transcriptional regulator with XRE-family HTH domain
MENSEIKDRILKILNTENISSAKFADTIGVQRSNISHILSGRNNPGLDFLQKVLVKFPAINPEWLLIGKGEIFKQKLQTEITFEKTTQPISKQENKNYIETIIPQEMQTNQIIRKQKTIKQVMVFYDDNTYEVLKPEKDLILKDSK